MTTTSVSTPASNASALPVGPSSASRQAGNAGEPFRQMLSNEIKDKTRDAGKTAERSPETGASGKAAATDKNAAVASDKSHAQSGEADRKEEASDSTVAGLSPELAAMIASLLQRQAAAAEGEAAEADSHALLGQARQRLGEQALAEDKSLLDLAKDKQAMAAERTLQSGAHTSASTKPELDLKTLAASPTITVDGGGEETQPTEFNSVLQMNQAALTTAKNANQPAMQAHIAPRVGTQGWDQALGQRVVWMAHGAEQSASLTLNPPELGPLQVTLNVSNSQAQASFVAPHADVRQALEAALPRLREMLEEVGIQLGQASVNQGSAQQQGEFARSHSEGGAGSEASGNNDLSTVEATATSRRVSTNNGLVDTFA